MRTCGILMHITSLPSNYGIGTFGKSAYEFADFLKDSGQYYWQLLPLNPTGFGDSPYQSFSAFAGNPYFIDLDILSKEGYLSKEAYKNINWGKKSSKVDYETIYYKRNKVFNIIFNHFKNKIPQDFYQFVEKNSDWLDDYSTFMAIKDYHNGKAWLEWDKDYKTRDINILNNFINSHHEKILFYKMLQYFFYKQWNELKSYVNKLGIKIIGDIPIYVASDSSDVWANPKNFMLDGEGNPIEVAGCPPDNFTEKGQLWGNPLYNWDKMKLDNYSWWIKRISYACKIQDVIRIDHFRGFDSYYCIPANAPDAKKGTWRKGPGMSLFNEVKKQLGNVPIIAEDLGFLTDSVKDLLKNSGFPGMKILQFAFDSREESNYLPYFYPNNCIAYTGTHDNDTIVGWLDTLTSKDRHFAIDYMRLNKDEGYNWGMIKTLLSCNADTAIITMQDLLNLDSKARMNTPSTCGNNWQWRCSKKDFSTELSNKIKKYVSLYGRMVKEEN